MIDHNHPLAVACCANDDDALIKQMPEIVKQISGYSIEDVQHVAEQRALRLYLIINGRKEELKHLQGGEEIHVTDPKKDLFPFMTGFVDGLLVGMRIKKGEQNNDNSETKS